MENFETNELKEPEYVLALDNWNKKINEENKQQETTLKEDDWEC